MSPHYKTLGHIQVQMLNKGFCYLLELLPGGKKFVARENLGQFILVEFQSFLNTLKDIETWT